MVFAFALTLLVVSSDPPTAFSELITQLWGFPGFAAAFAILLLIWHSHYIYFRRYALEDAWTTALNAGLLFLILFFVYPLKYLAIMLSSFVRSVAAGDPAPPLSLADAQVALIMLSTGYAAVFFMFAALYGHALSKSHQLELDTQEYAQTRFSYWQQVVHVGVGLAVALAAVLAPVRFAAFAGFLFFLIGPLIFLVSLAVPTAPAAVARAPRR